MTDKTKQIKFISAANEINKTFDEIGMNDRISLPRIIVVGVQGSGKSSLLNRIMNLNILPVGNRDLITKTPIHIEMQKATDCFIEIGYYLENKWILSHRLTFDEFTETQINSVQEKIQLLSDMLTEEKQIVLDKSIYIKITSPFVKDLSLIDLPGLPEPSDNLDENTVTDIQNLIRKYIKQSGTIVLMVIQSRTDNLENDEALALVKNTVMDCKDVLTLGILTKPDLLDLDNNGNDMSKFLIGEISGSLILDLGYYIVNCREDEKKYFTEHDIYSKTEYKDRCGVINLVSEISNILIGNIKKSISPLMIELNNLEEETKQNLKNIETKYPTEENNKLYLINIMIRDFSNRLDECISSKGSEPNIGFKINNIFNGFRKNINNVNFNEIITDKVICNIRNDFNGYHMRAKITTLDVLEKIVTCDLRPLGILRSLCMEFLDTLVKELFIGIDDVLKLKLFRFSKLNIQISQLLNDHLNKSKYKVKEMINKIIDSEESYVWTNNSQFMELLETKKIEHDIFDTYVVNNNVKIRKLICVYFETIKNSIINQIPKLIVCIIINDLRQYTYQLLITELSKNYTLIDQDLMTKNDVGRNNKILVSIKIAKEMLAENFSNFGL